MTNRWRYLGLAALVALATFGITMLLVSVFERKEEARHEHLRLVDLSENTIDPAEWGKNFPRQYDGYLRTVDTARTKYGGSEAFDRLKADPRLKRMFGGYAFALEYREERGHAYTLRDQDETARVKQRTQTGSCLHCHASIIPAYRKAGGGDIMKGFEAVCAMPWGEARKLVTHPVACIDCHDPNTMALRVTRPGFLNGIRALKKSQGVENYDPNKSATRQEMRTFVCGQCHVEYYFAGPNKVVTYPWSQGLKVENIEAYYDQIGFSDWTHEETGAPVLKAQHPEFELFNQGIHARSNVACADCHMPYIRQGAQKISDHHVRSPLLNVHRACITCHPFPEDEMKARAELIQDRVTDLMSRAENALMALYDDVKAATQKGATDANLTPARAFVRKAQFRIDFVNAENSRGFHAPHEAERILAEAIDYARQGQLSLRPLR
jgi:nitrite reductase (cytochrome c-552)